MKDKIKQAGFKTNKEFAEYMGVTKPSVFNWCKKPPRSVVEHLNLIIECHRLEKENMRLQEAIKTFKQYCNQ